MNFCKENDVVSCSEKGPFFGIRHLQTLLLFLCGLIAYWTRVNLSVAIVAMTKPVNPDFEIFDWDEQLKSYILSSFYWGYILTQLPSGHLGHRIGTKLMLFITIAVPSVLTILSPICVSYGGWGAFCAIRVLEGFFSGGIFPLFHNHLAHWCPVNERNLLGAITYSGVEIGTVMAFLFSGLIAASSIGWPGIFYVPGVLGLLWCVLWYCYGANSPNDYKSISKIEQLYIESSLKDCKTQHPEVIPWKHILTSVPFIALIVARISHSWGFQTLLTETPTFVHSILKLDIKSNAVYSALPYLVMWILGYVFLFLAEILMKKPSISLTLIRKTFNSISQWGPALALIGLALAPPENLPLALSFLIFAISLGSASTIGSVLNHIDLSPNYAGVLMGIANTVANFISIIVPLIIGLIVPNEIFDWDEQLKSYILSSFYWGYILTQLPSGHLGHRIGTKLMLFITIAVPSVLTILSPICVSYGGWGAFCAIRVLEGFFSGGIFPLFHNHLAHWCPVNERNLLGAITYSGVEIGTVMAFLFSGLIAASSIGWPGIFYVPGVLGLLWCVLWYCYGANSPNDYKSISKIEQLYIESSLKDCKTQHPEVIPWKHILTSVPFIALIVARISHSWGFQTLLTETPTFVHSILKLDIKSNAVYSALPYLVMWILGYVFLFLAEILMKKPSISLTLIRKTFNSISQWGPALALIGLALAPPENLPLALSFLIFAISLGSASTIGSVLNHIDLSPNYAGVLMGIANTVANFISIIVPLIIGLIVPNEIFDWDEQLKSYILSSFYWGYILTQLPSGHLGHRIGTKLMLFITIAVPSVLTILSPICVSYGGWGAFCAIRVLEGFFSGGIFPLFHNHLAHWCPVNERNLLGAITYSGVEIGTVMAFLFSGLIAASSIGWPGIFYVPGVLGLLWCVLWYCYGANSPNDYKSISKIEQLYIESSLKDCKTQHPEVIPWKHILTSVPFIALIVARISHSWGFQTLLTETPTFVHSILKLDIKSNAVYSALPYLVMWILGYVFLFLAEILMKKPSISLTLIRKTFNSISQWGPALALIGLALAPPENLPLALSFLIFAISLGSASTIGSVLNHIDLSPNYAGVLMGIANTVANFISIIVPLIIGLIVPNEEIRSQWQIVFYMAAGLYFVGNTVYIIFGQMVQQPWNTVKL